MAHMSKSDGRRRRSAGKTCPTASMLTELEPSSRLQYQLLLNIEADLKQQISDPI
jgi:hypothetical protein